MENIKGDGIKAIRSPIVETQLNTLNFKILSSMRKSTLYVVIASTTFYISFYTTKKKKHPKVRLLGTCNVIGEVVCYALNRLIT